MNITDRIVEIIVELSGQEAVKLADALQMDLGLDSLAMVTLLIEIEEAFGIELDEADMNPFDLETVESVVALVRKYGGDNDAEES